MTPKERLTYLESELQKALAQSDKVAKLKAEIASLKKLISDEEAGENQYAKEYAGVVQEQAKKKEVADAQSKTANDNTTQADRDRVKAETADVNGKIANLAAQAATATTDSDNALKTLNEKKEATKKAQADLAALKEPWKAAQKALKDAETLIAAADLQIQAKNYLVAYFLALEASASLTAANLEKPEDYNKKLSAATQAVYEAVEAEQAAKDDSDAKAAAKTVAQKAHDDAKAKRQETVIRRINEGAAAPAGGGGAAVVKPGP